MRTDQTQWGHKEQPQSEMFVGCAQSIGLDLERFRHDLQDPATAARVADDKADGERAGSRARRRSSSTAGN